MLGTSKTKEQLRRFDAIQERGCVPCWLESRFTGRKHEPEPCDIHHTDGSKNHNDVYGNCPWHHRGVPKGDLRPSDMLPIFGPSMALHPREYRIRYGTENDLLAYQRAMLLKSPHEL